MGNGGGDFLAVDRYQRVSARDILLVGLLHGLVPFRPFGCISRVVIADFSPERDGLERLAEVLLSFLLQNPPRVCILSATSSRQIKMKQPLFSILLAAATLTLTSCSTTTYGPIDDKNHNATYEKGVPGGTVVETYELTATVNAIDAPTRKVTLVEKDGEKTTVKCGPDVINFDQIRVGDIVRATVTSQLTIAMADAAAPPSDSSAGVVLLAPKGAKPGGLMAETQEYTATITGINLKRHQATLRFPDDSVRTFTARKDVDLRERKVGEKVTFRVTVAMAISIKKP